MIADSTYKFIIDTGADYSIISPRISGKRTRKTTITMTDSLGTKKKFTFDFNPWNEMG